MRAHLVLDGVFAAVFLAAPFLLEEESRPVRIALAALGVSGASTAALTTPTGRPQRRRCGV